MKKISLLIFCIAVLGHIASAQLLGEYFQFLFKPLIIPSLFIYLYCSISKQDIFTKLIFLALVFSWTGDVLLMFEKYKPVFFLFGLGSFLIAHLFFIFSFAKICSAAKMNLKLWILILSILIYNILIAILYHHLGSFLLPVCIYGFAICLMLSFALHLIYLPNKEAGQQIALGASFFVISDACLALNKFYHPFIFAGVVIMITYALAQLLIVKGIITYSNANHSLPQTHIN